MQSICPIVYDRSTRRDCKVRMDYSSALADPIKCQFHGQNEEKQSASLPTSLYAVAAMCAASGEQSATKRPNTFQMAEDWSGGCQNRGCHKSVTAQFVPRKIDSSCAATWNSSSE